MNPVIVLDEVDKLGSTFGATRPRHSWKSSTPRRTTPSATTIWKSTSTSHEWMFVATAKRDRHDS